MHSKAVRVMYQLLAGYFFKKNDSIDKCASDDPEVEKPRYRCIRESI